MLILCDPTDAQCSVIVWLLGLQRCSPVSLWWTGCSSSLKPVNCEICAVARSHGGQGKELLHHARVFPRVGFPAAVLLSYHDVFSEVETGARGDSHRATHQSPISVCVCSTFGSNTCEHSSNAGFHTIHTIPLSKCINPSVQRNVSQLSLLQY